MDSGAKEAGLAGKYFMPNKTSYVERVVPGATSYVTYQEHLNRYIFASRFIENKSVLDVSCGTGYGSDFLIKNGARKVIGLDISQDAINYAKNAYEDRRLKFILGDIINLPFYDESFDVIVSFETIEHIENQEQTLVELRRVLKPDGLLVISSPNRKLTSPGRTKREPWNPYHVIEYSSKEFISVLKKYFSIVGVYGQKAKSKVIFLPILEKFLRHFLPQLYSLEFGGSDVRKIQFSKEYVYLIVVGRKK